MTKQTIIRPAKVREITSKNSARVNGIEGVSCVEGVDVPLGKPNIGRTASKVSHQNSFNSTEIPLPEKAPLRSHEHLLDPIVLALAAARNILHVGVKRTQTEAGRVMTERRMNSPIASDLQAATDCHRGDYYTTTVCECPRDREVWIVLGLVSISSTSATISSTSAWKAFMSDWRSAIMCS